jgi:hypothetical protein
VVLRRLLVIGLLALISVAGVASTTAMASTSFSSPSPAGVGDAATPPERPTAQSARAVPLPRQRSGDGTDSASGARSAPGATGVPCLQQASCAGGVLLAGATLLLFLPVAGLALPVPAPAAPVVALPERLRSALLASKLFRPPRAS